MSSTLTALSYQLNTDIVLSLSDLIEGTDYTLSPIEVSKDLVQIKVTFLRSVKQTQVSLAVPSSSSIQSTTG